jgi:hypothetical protein
VADKPDGKQRNERITFTRPAAERIAKVVRQVEGGDRDSSGLTFRRVPPQGEAGKVFRIATFTGAWSINAAKTVTFKYQTTTPNTVVATNLFAAVPAPSGSGDCAIAKEGTAWYLVEFARQTTSVTVITGVTLSTAGLSFTRAVITVDATATQSVTIIGTTAC